MTAVFSAPDLGVAGVGVTFGVTGVGVASASDCDVLVVVELAVLDVAVVDDV